VDIPFEVKVTACQVPAQKVTNHGSYRARWSQTVVFKLDNYLAKKQILFIFPRNYPCHRLSYIRTGAAFRLKKIKSIKDL
jgi:hypothetical protein